MTKTIFHSTPLACYLECMLDDAQGCTGLADPLAIQDMHRFPSLEIIWFWAGIMCFFFCVHLCLLFEHSYKQRDWVKYVTEVKLGFFISMFWCLSFRFFKLSFVTCRKHALLHRSPRYDRLKCWSPLGVSSCAHPPFRSHPSLLKQPLLTGIQLSYFSLLWRKVCILFSCHKTNTLTLNLPYVRPCQSWLMHRSWY